MDERDPRLDALLAALAPLGRAVVAYSGGVDSTLLAVAARMALGDGALAVTLVTESDPADEMENAARMAADLGLRHRVLRAEWLDIPGVRHNPADRCYRCKKHLFGHLLEVAREEGATAVLEGSNADDRGDYRPGMQAVAELGIRSPLLELGLSKQDVRDLSARLGLPTASRPSMACLASRFPYGDDITRDALQRVDAGERALRALGFRVVRVRAHGTLARVEVAPGELEAAFAARAVIAARLHAVGYHHVALDLDGYRTGSMNATLGKEP